MGKNSEKYLCKTFSSIKNHFIRLFDTDLCLIIFVRLEFFFSINEKHKPIIVPYEFRTWWFFWAILNSMGIIAGSSATRTSKCPQDWTRNPSEFIFQLVSPVIVHRLTVVAAKHALLKKKYSQYNQNVISI